MLFFGVFVFASPPSFPRSFWRFRVAGAQPRPRPASALSGACRAQLRDDAEHLGERAGEAQTAGETTEPEPEVAQLLPSL